MGEVKGLAAGTAGVAEGAGAGGVAAGTATGGVAAAAGFAVVGATVLEGLAGEAWGTTDAEGFGGAAVDGEVGVGEAWESSWGAADCGVGTPGVEALAPESWATAGGAGRSGGTATAASRLAFGLDPAGGGAGETSAGASGADFRTSAARVGPAATTANPRRGRTARVRGEPAEGRSKILLGLAPAMEGERLVRRNRDSG